MISTEPRIAADVEGLRLTGLDGANPLAFLAAIGTLRTLDRAWPDKGVRLAWTDQAGSGWTPWISSSNGNLRDREEDRVQVLDAMDAALIKEFDAHPANSVLQHTALEPDERHSFFETFLVNATHEDRNQIDWLAALTAELAPDATSQIQTVRKDYFTGNLKSIMASTTRDDLHRSLFQLWDYSDALDNQSLHIDPSEDRRHAYQWHRPSGDPTKKKLGGMLGANRLMIEAFPFLPSMAMGDRLQTIGFTGTTTRNTRWTWPIWSCPINCCAVRTVLAHPKLQEPDPDSHSLALLGVVAVFRNRRILVEKTPNFTPSRSLG